MSVGAVPWGWDGPESHNFDAEGLPNCHSETIPTFEAEFAQFKLEVLEKRHSRLKSWSNRTLKYENK